MDKETIITHLNRAIEQSNQREVALESQLKETRELKAVCEAILGIVSREPMKVVK